MNHTFTYFQGRKRWAKAEDAVECTFSIRTMLIVPTCISIRFHTGFCIPFHILQTAASHKSPGLYVSDVFRYVNGFQ